MQKLQEALQYLKKVYSSFIQELNIYSLIVLIIVSILIISLSYFVSVSLPYILVVLFFVWVFFDMPIFSKPKQKEQTLQIDINWLASYLYKIIASHSNEAGIVNDAGSYIGSTQILYKANGVKMFILTFPIVNDEIEIDLKSLQLFLNRILILQIRSELFNHINSLYIGNIPKIQLANIKDEDGYRKFFVIWVERREDAEQYFQHFTQ